MSFPFSPADGDPEPREAPVAFKAEPNEASRSFADAEDDDTSQSSSQPTLDGLKAEVKQGELDRSRTNVSNGPAFLTRVNMCSVTETLDLESDTEETEFDDDEFDDNDPYSFSEDEAGLSPRTRKCPKPKIEKMKFEDR